MRRALDICFALVAGLALLPLMLVLAAAVAAAMGRPVLFSQQRSGLGGRPFRLVKFRSMTVEPENHDRPLPDEARITPLGRLLRRTRLDELPEIWNVLRGDMSLIGPRPLLLTSIAAMGASGKARGSVRPGLTGWAQVNGNALLDERDKTALDLWYIRNRSVGLDAAILCRTLGVIVAGERVRAAELERAYAGGHRRGR